MIFVGGLHRSGTSMLHEILRRHEAISGFRDTGVEEDEGQLLQDVYPAARAHGGPGRFGFDPAAHLTESSAFAAGGAATRLLDQWKPHWDLSRPVLVEKSPPNLIRMRFLQGLFPDASFVAVLRHPLVVSLATRKWTGRQSLESLLRHWIRCHHLLRADAPHINRLLVVKYERLCLQPEEVLEMIARFVGIDATLDPSVIDPSGNQHYADQWRRWQHGLDRHVYGSYIRYRYGRVAQGFGYDLKDLDSAGALIPEEQRSRP